MTTTAMGIESVGYRLDQISTIGSNLRLAPDVGMATDEYVSVRVRGITPRNVRTMGEHRSERKKVLRRMQGFLIEVIGKEAKVALVEDGKTYLYYLPYSRLKDADISAENQPFQMDEVEIKTDDGVFVGYIFQALAKPSDAFQDSFKLDAERERKRDLIFQAFGHVKT
jgi:hypothetical protein